MVLWELRACGNMDPGCASARARPVRWTVDVVITYLPYSTEGARALTSGRLRYQIHGSSGAFANRLRELGFAPLMPAERAAMAQALRVPFGAGSPYAQTMKAGLLARGP